VVLASQELERRSSQGAVTHKPNEDYQMYTPAVEEALTDEQRELLCLKV
jgi:hypothetical protein